LQKFLRKTLFSPPASVFFCFSPLFVCIEAKSALRVCHAANVRLADYLPIYSPTLSKRLANLGYLAHGFFPFAYKNAYLCFPLLGSVW
jgi:hypothetical protein